MPEDIATGQTQASEVWRLSAVEAVGLLRRGEITPAELIDAAAARIEAVNPTLNALPVVFADRAREAAARLPAKPPQPDRPWLAGLPLAIKDYNDVAGFPTTAGSPIFKDAVAERSDHLVLRLEERGGVPMAKSNVPEFAGANTFNRVYGKTVNPWDTRMSAAGSSGGAASALASGMIWLAHGNDLGGSLRTPASFCSVVGLRPSPGRVARGPWPVPFDNLWVEGPMARTVADVALMLDALAGEHPDDPIALPAPAMSFLDQVGAARPPRKVAFSPDLGVTPVEPEVIAVCEKAARRYEEMGAVVEEACPDLSDAHEIFQTLRALMFATARGELLDEHRDAMPPEIVWNLEKGYKLTAEEIMRAERGRAALFHRVAAFFEEYDLLCCPAATVPPFPVDQRYVEEIAGRKCQTYIDWISITFAITLTSCPALSLPAGFTGDGLPVGLQIVGPPHGDGSVLGAGRLLEDTLGIAGRVPIEPQEKG